MNKEQLEDAINNSSLFEMDKESPQYERERKKFFHLLTNYYNKPIYKKSFAEYGGILIVKAAECLKSYKKDKAPFLHYLNISLRRAIATQAKEEGSGNIKIPTKKLKLLQDIKQYAKRKNLDLEDSEILEEIAKALSSSVQEVQELIQINKGLIVQDIMPSNENGERISIWDILQDERVNIEEDILQQEKYIEYLECLNSTYQKQQERQKNLLSMLITNEVCKALGVQEKIMELQKYAFYNESVVQYYIQNGKAYKQKDIAKIFKNKESDVSRVWTKFINKVKKNLGK